MPNSVTTSAWEFDPAFQLGQISRPADWIGNDSTDGSAYIESGSPINLGDSIVTVTITDTNEDELLSSGNSDSFSVNGVLYTLDLVYFGDQVTVDNQAYTLVTMYGENAEGGQTAITLPVQDGQITAAFPGFATSTEWLFTPNEFDLPFDEVPCFTRGTSISTVVGEILIEDLRIGDLVLTKDNGPQPVR